jgi:hypothetical protein
MQKYYFLLYCLFNIFRVEAQSIEVDLENKYWNYRDRLKKNFVQIGSAPGQSISAAQLLEFSSPSDTLQYQNGILKKVEPKTYKNRMVFGDVLVDQGYYLAVLSSELNILTLEGKQNSERYKSVCVELYWAIYAIDRLDAKAEEYLNYSILGMKNGFLIRSDNDEKFLSRVAPLKKLDPQRVDFLNSGGANGPAIKFKDSSNGFVSGVFDYEDYKINSATPRNGEGISWIKGANWNGTTYNYGNEMSQDQVYGLLMGFMCVKQWTSPTLSIDPDGDDITWPSKNIHTWIAEITARIMNHISKDFKHKVFAGDVSNYYEKLNKESCDEIIKKPYWCDTIRLITPDTLYDVLFDDTFGIIKIDTLISYYRDSMRTSSVSFPGAKLRDCNLWQQAVENYEKKEKFPIFKESNYIITNPVRDNKIVTRGHLAIPFAYPIIESAKYLTHADTFPEPRAVLSNSANIYRFVGWPLTGAVLGVGGKQYIEYTLIKQFLSTIGFEENQLTFENLKFIVEFIKDRCTKTSQIDFISLCILGKPLMPQTTDYYRDLWNAYRTSPTLKMLVVGKFQANLQHNLALASRTWTHAEFSDWCDDMGYEFSELFYCMLHGGNPIKSRQFYSSTLDKAQCEGIFHAGDTSVTQKSIRPYNSPAPFNKTNIFSSAFNSGDSTTFAHQQAGLDYMLLYNLYKMADLNEKWGASHFRNTDLPEYNCPCVSYPDMPFTSMNRSILEELHHHQSDTIDGLLYRNKTMYLPKKILENETDSIFPYLEHYKNYDIRIPNYLLHDLKVHNEGTLKINQDLNICGSSLVVDSLGMVELLSAAKEQFISQIVVTKGSELVLKRSGQIVINNNSKLLVDVGGKLKFEKGARIILDGPNAVLHIKGILEIGSNAIFKIEGGTNGKGYIIWENNWNGITNNNTAKLISNTNSSILLENANSGQLTLKIIGNGGFNTSWNLAQFKIKKARVDLGPEAYLMCESQYTILDSVEVHGFMDKSDNPLWNYTPCSRGIHIMGVKNQFSRITIYDCKEGIVQRDLVGVHEPLKLINVDLINCLSAITNLGGKIQYRNGNIGNLGYKQLRNGIVGIGTQGNSIFQNINIHLDYFNNDPNCGYPLGSGETVTNFWNHGTSRNFFTNCTISSAKNGAVLNQSYLIARCSYFSNNINQITMFQNSLFNANNNAWNRFYWNTSSADKKFLIGRNGVFVYLDRGSNYIMGHQDNSSSFFIDADLHYTHPLFTSSNASGNNSLAVNATINEWAIGGIGGLNTFFSSNSRNINFEYASVFGAIYDINYTPVFNGNHIASRDNACNGKVINYNWWPVDSILVSKANAGGFNGSLIKLRADSLKYELENSPKDYTSIITKAKILFNTPLPDNIGGDIIEIYSTIQSAYLDVFTDSTIPASSKNAIQTSVYNGMLDLQQNLVDQADGPNQRLWQLFRFEVHRDFALIHRVFNNRPTAINYLNQVLPTFSKPSDVVSLEAWRCLIEKEQAYLDSLIPYWQISLDTCLIGLEQALNNDSISTEWMPDWKNRYKGGESSSQFSQTLNTSKEESNSTKLNYRISPNPTTGICLIESDELIIQCKVYNSSGKQILSFEPKSKVFQFDLSSSPKGIYIVKSTTKLGVNSSKIIVQ